MPQQVTNVNQLIANLSASAELLANEMRTRTSSGRYPSGLSDSIVVGQPKSMDNRYMVRISVNHPAGAAYEFGSGLHSTRGPQQKYKIEPRNVSALAISEEKWPDFEFPVIPGKKMMGFADGKFFLRYVDHPGVEARPYAEPSIQSKKKEIAKLLGRAFVASIIQREKTEIEIRVEI